MTSTIEQTADRIVNQEVLCCMSHMVSTLAVDYSRIANSNLSDLAEQACNLSASVPDYEEAALQADCIKQDDGTWTLTNDATGLPVDFPDAQSICEWAEIEPYEREVFEFWAVSTWFADKLIEQGEQVDKDFAGLCVWARTTSGQGIAQDHVVQTIAASIVSNS